MRTLEVKTTQNVSISYELASARDRAFAFILDLIFKGTILFLLLLIWQAMPRFFTRATEEFFLYLVYIPVAFMSMLIMEITMKGQTWGKKLLKIQVIKLTGKQPDFYDYLLRWCFRLIDVFSATGVPALILISSTEYGQRLGDMVANTTVVKVQTKLNVSLQDVLKIDDLSRYKPVYEGIRNFSEDDVLLLKLCLDRALKYPNTAHKEALERAVTVMKEKLGIEETVQDPVVFLRTLIRDYIVLTR
jgi:uncharacterized RDD family membrane protein YckC